MSASSAELILEEKSRNPSRINWELLSTKRKPCCDGRTEMVWSQMQDRAPCENAASHGCRACTIRLAEEMPKPCNSEQRKEGCPQAVYVDTLMVTDM